jgi:hypothetical protein
VAPTRLRPNPKFAIKLILLLLSLTGCASSAEEVPTVPPSLDVLRANCLDKNDQQSCSEYQSAQGLDVTNSATTNQENLRFTCVYQHVDSSCAEYEDQTGMAAAPISSNMSTGTQMANPLKEPGCAAVQALTLFVTRGLENWNCTLHQPTLW